MAPPSITVQSQWRGIGLVDTIALGTGEIPPDMGGAAGPTHVLQVVNGGAAIYTRSGTRVGLIKTDRKFWRASGISDLVLSDGISDPRVIYDSASGRFFVTQITVAQPSPTNPNGHNAVLVGVSKTSDPTQGFRAVRVQLKNGVLGDFPTLGVNAESVTISTNNFGLAGFADLTVFSIPKADLLLPKPSAANVSRFDSLPSADGGQAVRSGGIQTNAVTPAASSTAVGYGFAIHGVTNQGPGNGTQQVLGVSGTNFRQFAYSTVVGAGTPTAGLSEANIIRTRFDGNVGPGRQPAGPAFPYDNGDDRVGAVIKQVGNYIYLANTVGNSDTAPTKNSVHFIIVDATTHKTVIDRLITDPTGKIDFSYPSIDANASGKVVIGYNGSGVNTNISAYATACNFDTTALAIACTAPRLLYAGLNSDYTLGAPGRVRWGDYSHTQNDPNDPNAFWLYLEVNGEKQLNGAGILRPRWATVITKIVTQ